MLPLGDILSLCETEKWLYRLEIVNLASTTLVTENEARALQPFHSQRSLTKQKE